MLEIYLRFDQDLPEICLRFRYNNKIIIMIIIVGFIAIVIHLIILVIIRLTFTII